MENDVRGIWVENCTISGTQNGVRVKTWPGDHASNATNLTFQNIVMINVSNPIIIDQQYCPNSSCDSREVDSYIICIYLTTLNYYLYIYSRFNFEFNYVNSFQNCLKYLITFVSLYYFYC